MTTPARTIVARLTPPGSAALASLGVHGPDATAVCLGLFGDGTTALAQAAPGRLFYGEFGGAARDDVVLRVRHGPPAAEVEIHCHGGPAMVEALIGAIERQGAQRVDWKEYLRAQGASPIKVEAAEALAECSTARCAAILLDQFNGALESAFDAVAHGRDAETVSRLLGWAPLGLHLVRPWRVILFGRVNVGKSSLLNALAGYRRAIVSATAGATRDVLCVRAALDGWPVELIDGAGFGRSEDPLESVARERLEQSLAQADLRVLVLDRSTALTRGDALLRECRPEIVVGNKRDRPSPWSEADDRSVDLTCSAVSGEGLPEFIDAVAARLVPRVPPPGEAVPFTERQVDWLKRHADAPGSSPPE